MKIKSRLNGFEIMEVVSYSTIGAGEHIEDNEKLMETITLSAELFQNLSESYNEYDFAIKEYKDDQISSYYIQLDSANGMVNILIKFFDFIKEEEKFTVAINYVDIDDIIITKSNIVDYLNSLV